MATGRKSGWLLLWYNYGKRLSMRGKIHCTFVIKLFILSKFMRWRGKLISATDRIKAQTQRGAQNAQSKESTTKNAIIKSEL